MADRQLIAIDIDNVIAELNDAVRNWTNERSDIKVEPEHYAKPGEYWHYHQRVWAEQGIELDYDQFLDDIATDSIEVPLLAGAAFAVKELMKTYDVALVTARVEPLRAHTERWAKEHLGDGIKVYMAGNKLEGHAMSKGQMLKHIGATLLIDDSLEHCLSAEEEGVEAILFGEYAWHQNVPDHIVRCKDWPSVLEHIEAHGPTS